MSNITSLMPTKTSILINNDILNLRFTIFSELYLELHGLSRIEIANKSDVLNLTSEETTYLLKAGLSEYKGSFEFDNIQPIYDDLYKMVEANANKEFLNYQIIRALTNSLPIPSISDMSENTLKSSGKETDYMWFRCLFVDIIHRTEKEFWNSTLREIFERYDMYAIAKGYKKPVEEVQRYNHKERKKGGELIGC